MEYTPKEKVTLGVAGGLGLLGLYLLLTGAEDPAQVATSAVQRGVKEIDHGITRLPPVQPPAEDPLRPPIIAPIEASDSGKKPPRPGV